MTGSTPDSSGRTTHDVSRMTRLLIPPWRTSASIILRLEGLVVMLGAVAAFQVLDGSWGFFALLFLAPDLFMLGYLRGPKVGAWVYNFAHTYSTPAALGVWWFVTPELDLLPIAAIWTAHIGLDRALGLGLKEVTGFKDTHLQRV